MKFKLLNRNPKIGDRVVCMEDEDDEIQFSGTVYHINGNALSVKRDDNITGVGVDKTWSCSWAGDRWEADDGYLYYEELTWKEIIENSKV